MMRTASPLLPLFRSAHQGRLLALVLFDPEIEHTVADLARTLGVNHATVSREVDRLETAGLLASRRRGGLRLVRADVTSPVADEVRALALKAFGPAWVIAEQLRGIEGIGRAYIYGSFAERAAGRPGPPPGDIDVMVIGTADRDAIFAAAATAGRHLGRDVNAIVRSDQEWDDPNDVFLQTVRQGALVEIPLDPSER